MGDINFAKEARQLAQGKEATFYQKSRADKKGGVINNQEYLQNAETLFLNTIGSADNNTSNLSAEDLIQGFAEVFRTQTFTDGYNSDFKRGFIQAYGADGITAKEIPDFITQIDYLTKEGTITQNEAQFFVNEMVEAGREKQRYLDGAKRLLEGKSASGKLSNPKMLAEALLAQDPSITVQNLPEKLQFKFENDEQKNKFNIGYKEFIKGNNTLESVIPLLDSHPADGIQRENITNFILIRSGFTTNNNSSIRPDPIDTYLESYTPDFDFYDSKNYPRYRNDIIGIISEDLQRDPNKIQKELGNMSNASLKKVIRDGSGYLVSDEAWNNLRNAFPDQKITADQALAIDRYITSFTKETSNNDALCALEGLALKNPEALAKDLTKVVQIGTKRMPYKSLDSLTAQDVTKILNQTSYGNDFTVPGVDSPLAAAPGPMDTYLQNINNNPANFVQAYLNKDEREYRRNQIVKSAGEHNNKNLDKTLAELKGMSNEAIHRFMRQPKPSNDALNTLRDAFADKKITAERLMALEVLRQNFNTNTTSDLEATAFNDQITNNPAALAAAVDNVVNEITKNGMPPNGEPKGFAQLNTADVAIIITSPATEKNLADISSRTLGAGSDNTTGAGPIGPMDNYLKNLRSDFAQFNAYAYLNNRNDIIRFHVPDPANSNPDAQAVHAELSDMTNQSLHHFLDRSYAKLSDDALNNLRVAFGGKITAEQAVVLNSMVIDFETEDLLTNGITAIGEQAKTNPKALVDLVNAEVQKACAAAAADTESAKCLTNLSVADVQKILDNSGIVGAVPGVDDNAVSSNPASTASPAIDTSGTSINEINQNMKNFITDLTSVNPKPTTSTALSYLELSNPKNVIQLMKTEYGKKVDDQTKAKTVRFYATVSPNDDSIRQTAFTEVLKAMDTDHNNQLTMQELRAVSLGKDNNNSSYIDLNNVTAIEDFLNVVDPHKTGTINLLEFEYATFNNNQSFYTKLTTPLPAGNDNKDCRVPATKADAPTRKAYTAERQKNLKSEQPSLRNVYAKEIKNVKHQHKTFLTKGARGLELFDKVATDTLTDEFNTCELTYKKGMTGYDLATLFDLMRANGYKLKKGLNSKYNLNTRAGFASDVICTRLDRGKEGTTFKISDYFEIAQ